MAEISPNHQELVVHYNTHKKHMDESSGVDRAKTDTRTRNKAWVLRHITVGFLSPELRFALLFLLSYCRTRRRRGRLGWP